MNPVDIEGLTLALPNDKTYNIHVDIGEDLKKGIDPVKDFEKAQKSYENIFRANDDSFGQLLKSTIDVLQKELESTGTSFDKVCILNIDPQVDFVDGALGGADTKAVQERKKCLKLAAAISWWARSKGALVLATRDHHPKEHISFSTTHKGADPFKMFSIPKNDANQHIFNEGRKDVQIVWPVHCVQGSIGSSIHSAFDKTVCHHIEPKGMDKYRESYSCIRDVYGQKASRVDDILQNQKIQTVVVTSLCAGFCVGNSAMDLAENDYTVIVPEAAIAGVFPGEVKEMNKAFLELKHGKRRSYINNPDTSAPIDLNRKKVGQKSQIRLKVLPAGPGAKIEKFRC